MPTYLELVQLVWQLPRELGNFGVLGNPRRALEDVIHLWNAPEKCKSNLRRFVAAFEDRDPCDVLAWLSRLRKVSRAQPFSIERVIAIHVANDLHDALVKNRQQHPEYTNAATQVRNIVRTLITSNEVMAVSYSYAELPMIDDVYRAFFDKLSDLNSAVLWVDRHEGLRRSKHDEWYEYGLVPYTLCETVTINFDKTRTWMLVERAVRNGVNTAVSQSGGSASLEDSVRNQLLTLVKSQDFHDSHTNWRRDKQFLQLMIELPNTNRNVFKLPTVEVSLKRQRLLYPLQGGILSSIALFFSIVQRGVVKMNKDLYPVGLIQHLEATENQILKNNYEKTTRVAQRMRGSSRSDTDDSAQYWKKVAARQAFEAYAQVYTITEGLPAPYELDPHSPNSMFRSCIRILHLVMLLIAWDRDGFLACLVRRSAIWMDFVYDLFVLGQLAHTGQDVAVQDVANLMLFRITLHILNMSVALSSLIFFGLVVLQVAWVGILRGSVQFYEVREKIANVLRECASGEAVSRLVIGTAVIVIASLLLRLSTRVFVVLSVLVSLSIYSVARDGDEVPSALAWFALLVIGKAALPLMDSEAVVLCILCIWVDPVLMSEFDVSDSTLVLATMALVIVQVLFRWMDL